MKRLPVIALIFAIMLLVCGCAKSSVPKDADVILTFNNAEENICVTLENEESVRIANILDGNTYDPIAFGEPSCGFHANIALKVGDQVFAVARDTCNIIQDLGKQRYFDISEEDMEYIYSLFEKYGGYFPCV